MAIQFRCPNCSKRLRVSESNIGKKAKCPKCGDVNRIPQESEDEFATVEPNERDLPQKLTEQFFVDSVAGKTFGPVDLDELANWADQGRVSANCLIRSEYSDESKPAFAYFPHLGKPDHPTAKNPPKAHPASSIPQPAGPPPASFSSPYEDNIDEKVSRPKVKVISANAGHILSYSASIFKVHFGTVMAAALPLLMTVFCERLLVTLPGYLDSKGIFLEATVLNLMSLGRLMAIAIGIYFFVGQTSILSKLALKKKFRLADVVLGVVRFFPTTAYCLITFGPFLGIALLISQFSQSPSNAIAAYSVTTLGGIISWFLFWAGAFLVADGRASLGAALKISPTIALKNLSNISLVALASAGLALAGVLAFGIGIFFAGGFIALIWNVAYLMMSGKIEYRKLYSSNET